MASKLRALRRNISKLEKQGFILPAYVKQITKESTASKYTQKELMRVSKFKETYQGKERIVSGERGIELILRERARKGAETRRKKKEEKERIWTRENQAIALELRLHHYFNSFNTRTLGEMFRDLFISEKESYDNQFDFLFYILDIESDVIETVQRAMFLKYPNNSSEEIQESYNEWLNLITNYSPTKAQREALGNAEDEQ